MPAITAVKTAGNTVYPRPMAKVMISLPDELLERIDKHLKSTKESRSGFLRRLAEDEIRASQADERKHFEDLLRKATAPMGGDAVRMIREDRER
jgi:HicB_like antitoxin of bacterial toxin-antitoxin system